MKIGNTKMEISKELLSEVYNFDIKDIILLGTDDVTYEVRFNGLKNGLKYNIVNIYELSHKCKEWALGNGYEIVSMADTTKIYKNKYEIYNVTSTTPYCLENFFEACEWILKELK